MYLFHDNIFFIVSRSSLAGFVFDRYPAAPVFKALNPKSSSGRMLIIRTGRSGLRLFICF